MIPGHLKFYDNAKGYGVIASQDGKTEAVVHSATFELCGVRAMPDMKVDFEIGSSFGLDATGRTRGIAATVSLPR